MSCAQRGMEEVLGEGKVDRPLGQQGGAMGSTQGQQRYGLRVGGRLQGAATTAQDHVTLSVHGQPIHDTHMRVDIQLLTAHHCHVREVLR